MRSAEMALLNIHVDVFNRKKCGAVIVHRKHLLFCFTDVLPAAFSFSDSVLRQQPIRKEKEVVFNSKEFFLCCHFASELLFGARFCPDAFYCPDETWADVSQKCHTGLLGSVLSLTKMK